MLMKKSTLVFTKLQMDIMAVFAAKITKRFTIRGIAKLLKKDPALVHRSIKPLIKEGFLTLTEERQLMLNYFEHHQDLAYVESLRLMKFLTKTANKTVKFFTEDFLKNMEDKYFILIIFGSAVEKSNPRDIDIFVIVDDIEEVEKTERFLDTVGSRYNLKLDINVVSTKSIYEMANNRSQKNVLNELLNKHLIVYGAESFYRLLKNARR